MVKVAGSEIRQKGLFGRDIAVKYFRDKGYNVKHVGKFRADYDFIVEIDGLDYAVKTKHGKSFNISGTFFPKMSKLNALPSIFMISEDYQFVFLTKKEV